jgi:hypothetical protein
VHVTHWILAAYFHFSVIYLNESSFSPINRDQWELAAEIKPSILRQVRCPHEDLWLRVLRKSVVAVPVEVAPRARSRRVESQSTFNRIASLKLFITVTLLQDSVGAQIMDAFTSS